MKYSKVLTITAILTLGSLLLAAQAIPIGSNCPPIKLDSLLFPGKDVPEKWNFSKKLTIIDFWATGCIGCISAFPKMEKLSRDFGDQVQIILVNPETPDSTRRFFNDRPRIKVPNLPMIAGDKLLAGYFPHQTFPHHIWIDSTGKVIAITGDQNTTPEHLKAYLSGEKQSFAEKKMRKILNADWPLIMGADSSQVRNFDFFNYLIPAVPIYNSGLGRIIDEKTNKPYWIKLNNASILELIKAAFSEGGNSHHVQTNRIILEVKSLNKFDYPNDPNQLDQWLAKNRYCYELRLPKNLESQLFPIFQKQVCDYFNITAKWEKRLRLCYVLTQVGPFNILKSKGGPFDTNFFQFTKDQVKFIKYGDFLQFYDQLNEYNTAVGEKLPLINQVRFRGKIDMQLPAEVFENLSNYSLINQAIKKYGLQIIKKKELIEVLVVRDKK